VEDVPSLEVAPPLLVKRVTALVDLFGEDFGTLSNWPLDSVCVLFAGTMTFMVLSHSWCHLRARQDLKRSYP